LRGRPTATAAASIDPPSECGLRCPLVRPVSPRPRGVLRLACELLERRYATTAVPIVDDRALQAPGIRTEILRLDRLDDCCANCIDLDVARQGDCRPELDCACGVPWLVAPERNTDARHPVSESRHQGANAGMRHHQCGLWKHERVRHPATYLDVLGNPQRARVERAPRSADDANGQ